MPLSSDRVLALERQRHVFSWLAVGLSHWATSDPRSHREANKSQELLVDLTSNHVWLNVGPFVPPSLPLLSLSLLSLSSSLLRLGLPSFPRSPPPSLPPPFCLFRRPCLPILPRPLTGLLQPAVGIVKGCLDVSRSYQQVGPGDPLAGSYGDVSRATRHMSPPPVP